MSGGHDNWNGYTHGTSEGAWSRVPSGLMKYERAERLIYGSPDSEAYREGWERIFGAKRKEASCSTTTSNSF